MCEFSVYRSITYTKQFAVKPKPFLAFKTVDFLSTAPFTPIRASSDGFLDPTENEETLPFFKERPAMFLFWVVVWASFSLAWFAVSRDSNAAVDSIKTSSFGLKIASALRGFGWPDEAVVFALATLPVLELRGAIPVGYWMQLQPITLTVLVVIGETTLPSLFSVAKNSFEGKLVLRVQLIIEPKSTAVKFVSDIVMSL